MMPASYLLEGFIGSVLIHAMQVSGGAGRLFVLSTVTGLHQPRTTIGCCIGSHGHGDTVVNITGGHLSRNLSYVMKGYKVVCVDLTLDMVQTDLDEYNAVVVNSSGQVTVTVTIRSNTTVTSYLALPVDAWGNQYLFLVAQIYHSVVQVMSGVSSSDVIVTVKFPPPSYSNVSQHLDRHNVTLTHRVAPYKVWITSFCSREHDLTPVLSGVLELNGDHYFGVILTKCHRFKTDCSTYVDRNETKDRPDDKRTGQLASWAWPVELLGQEFIVLGLNWTAITHVMLMSSEANTSVSMMAGDSENYTTVHLAEARSFHVVKHKRHQPFPPPPHKQVLLCEGRFFASTQMRATFSTLTMHSTEPIYVYILRCKCQDVVADVTDILRDATLPVFVLPTCLFYHTYLWRSSFSNNPAIVETLITILPVSHEDVLSLDGTRLYKETVVHRARWAVVCPDRRAVVFPAREAVVHRARGGVVFQLERPWFSQLERPWFTELDGPWFAQIEGPWFAQIEGPWFFPARGPSFAQLERPWFAKLERPWFAQLEGPPFAELEGPWFAQPWSIHL
ncbi:hypothetical protein Btru_016182 [Bulinus truncatus]|nr:hypothetical protein Btru_016182 [Bulinus truncatus]